MGLIGARYIGGNNARGEFLAFIDAHVFVGPKWLKTPRKLLVEDSKTIVNYINFNLNTEAFLPKKAWEGIGSSATITMDLRQIWGGGSRKDMFSPITMGMFVISKSWWNQGAMDPDLRTWGGENVEISFRTWLCGGRIVVAKDSFVAHGFRTKFPYSINGRDIQRNYIRIANVWLDAEHLSRFYEASRISLKSDPTRDIGNITKRLQLKERLHCKPFSYYAEKFKGRALCLPSGCCAPSSCVEWMREKNKSYSCGGVMTVTPNDISYLTHEQMFFRNATR